MGSRKELQSLNQDLFEEITIDELESRIELAEAAPKTCGSYTINPQ